MQIDMHHYGTYALARAAGLNREAARIVANSAQFVDDNKAGSKLSFGDASRIDTEPSAHRLITVANYGDREQRRVWVPFHFLPGNEGETYTERLKCRIDSEISREMCHHYLTHYSDRVFTLQLLGIASHVYADTFSHYGFSGVSSRGNRVDNGSFRYHEEVKGLDNLATQLSPHMREYVPRKANSFFKERGEHGGLFANIKSWLGEEAYGALGHGSVATLPDRPYLVWSFNYEQEDAAAGGIQAVRNNPTTYLRCCRALHDMFLRFVNLRPELADGHAREFDAISPCVEDILLTQADKAGRIAAWQNAARAGELFGEDGEEIPDYEGEEWNRQWEGLDDAPNFSHAMDTPSWRFYQAASLHRTYVLRDLLPKHGLIAD